MAAVRRSPIGAALVVVVTTVTLGGFLLMRQAVSTQDHQLLKADAAQAAQLLSVDISSLSTSVAALGTVASLTNGQANAFDRYARSIALPGYSLLLARRVRSGFVVTGGVGEAAVPGRPVGAGLAADLASAGGKLTATLLRKQHGQETLAFVIGPPVTPVGTAVAEVTTFNAGEVLGTSTTTGPFANLNIALYASKSPSPNKLVLSTSASGALTGDTVRTTTPIGADDWLLIASAKAPLVGTLASDAPWIVLAVGIVVALMAGGLLDSLGKRERFASNLVTLRTAELERRNELAILINNQAELLHSCHTIGEASEVVGSSLPQLFPGVSGALYAYAPSRNRLNAMTQWGRAASEPFIDPNECWALRRGRLQSSSAGDHAPRCTHVAPDATEYLCVPMLAHGEILGLFHLSTQASQTEATSLPFIELTRLASNVSEDLALALGNLQLREKLRNLSIRDPLTDLFNRRYMEESLNEEFDRAARYGMTLGILMIDIDHFKNFNDSFGHDTGDLALRKVAAVFVSQLRGEDIACRYGGEEFVLVLPGVSVEGARTRAEAIASSIRALEVVPASGGSAQSVTISIGVACYPQDGTDAEHLIRAADSALYRAKFEGRDRVAMCIGDAV
jgi:diguanylate cyclase (GGDEF)-like protein